MAGHMSMCLVKPERPLPGATTIDKQILPVKLATRPIPLKNAPLQYAPENELGVVFLFSKIAKRLQFRI